ncbi:MAG TPA: hypothetical protein PLZ36_08545, partial [Armatimonadota bacterium]|nr:hypothetical protein [Armatimonadota bacterium]
MPTFAAAQSAHRAALERLFAGETPAYLLCLTSDYAGYYGPCEDAAFARWRDGELDKIADNLLLAGEDAVNFRPPVVEFSPLGVHWVDALFGVRVYQFAGQWWADPLPGRLADLDGVDVPGSPQVAWMTAALADLLARLPAELEVAGPVFSSTLNVAINLFGERALEDVLDPGPETIG